MIATTETRKPNLETRRQILLLRHQGLPLPKIAQRLRVSRQTVSGYLRLLEANNRTSPRISRGDRLPPLTKEQILGWARDHRRQHGRYPCITSGLIPGTDREIWKNIDQALRKGFRGLPGGSSLRDFLKSRGLPITTRRNGWTAEQDRLLGTMSDENVSARIGRTPVAVALRRRLLGIAKR